MVVTLPYTIFRKGTSYRWSSDVHGKKKKDKHVNKNWGKPISYQSLNYIVASELPPMQNNSLFNFSIRSQVIGWHAKAMRKFFSSGWQFTEQVSWGHASPPCQKSERREREDDSKQQQPSAVIFLTHLVNLLRTTMMVPEAYNYVEMVYDKCFCFKIWIKGSMKCRWYLNKLIFILHTCLIFEIGQ